MKKVTDTKLNPAGQSAIDWDRIRERVSSAQRTLDSVNTMSREDRRSILRARAKTLAHVPERKDEGRAALDVVEFKLANETYALQVVFVREVSLLADLTSLPGAPLLVSGIVSLRGRIVTVVDVKKLFELPEKGITDLHHVIVIADGERELGILADEVVGVGSIPIDEIGPPLATLTGIRTAYMRGVTNEALIVIDALKMLSDSALVTGGQAGA